MPRPDVGFACVGAASSSASLWRFSPPWPLETAGGTQSESPPAWTVPALRGKEESNTMDSIKSVIQVHRFQTTSRHMTLLRNTIENHGMGEVYVCKGQKTYKLYVYLNGGSSPLSHSKSFSL